MANKGGNDELCLGRRDACLLTGPRGGGEWGSGSDVCSHEEGIRRRLGTEVFNSMVHSRTVAGEKGAGMRKCLGTAGEEFGLWWRAVYTGPTGFEQVLEESQGGRY